MYLVQNAFVIRKTWLSWNFSGWDVVRDAIATGYLEIVVSFAANSGPLLIFGAFNQD